MAPKSGLRIDRGLYGVDEIGPLERSLVGG